IWNERQLRSLLADYLEHYNSHRPHRGLDQRAPDDPDGSLPTPPRSIERRTACSGLINEYRHAA
ncbi:MAG: transposase, partial [Acidimicrobiia bacterium]|nr:transposase [Acidimicrobiia bacterium]